MLTNFNDMLQLARKNHCAIPHFNINNLEFTKFILEKCQELNVPVILGVSINAAQYMGGWSVPVAFTKALIRELNLTIPICLHVDHGTKEECLKAITAGFTSVMIDSSSLSLQDNIQITKELVNYAHQYNVSVEGEIGEIKECYKGNFPTNLNECLKYYEETKVDALAPAIGNAHGIYHKNPTLNFNLIEELSVRINVPLVLHGASGISSENLKKLIKLGITKININTDLLLAWNNGLREFIKTNKDVYDPRQIISSGKQNVQEKIAELIETFETKSVT